MTLNGSALKTPDHPLEFVSVKYSISEKNYYNIRSDSETKNGMPNPDFLKNVLNTVCEGELVSIQTIEKNPIAIYNATEEEMIMLKSITNPTVHEDKGVATYEVEMFKFDTSNTDNPKMELIKKQVVVKLTDEIKNNPHSAYNVDKKDCKVKTLTKKVDVIKNSKIVSLNPNNR